MIVNGLHGPQDDHAALSAAVSVDCLGKEGMDCLSPVSMMLRTVPQGVAFRTDSPDSGGSHVSEEDVFVLPSPRLRQ
jgi:hypothetical protein